jgi:outer membrane protein assembly factor BamB
MIFTIPVFYTTGCAQTLPPVPFGEPISSVSSINPDEWLAFRGSDGHSRSPATGLLKQWPAGGPRLLWQVDFLGAGFSGVSISGDSIYISGNATRNGRALTMIFCLDKDGKLIWERDNGPAHTGSYPGTRGTPTIDGDFVYDVSPLGEVACFHARTGEKIWNRNLMTHYDAPMPRWFLGHSVIVDGDHLISPVGGARTIAIAMNKRTGETVWEAAPAPGNAPTGYTTPYIFEFEGTRVVAVMSNATVEGLDPATGRTLFSIPWTNSRNVHCTMPIYHNGHLFMTTGYDGGTARLFRLSKNTDGTITTRQVWVEPRFNNHHGGVVLVGDHVYGTSDNGSWCSINFMTGEVGYIISRHAVAGKGSVHYADGLLYGLTELDRTVLLIRPEPKEFVLVSSFELPNEAAGNSWAHPVVLNGRMYLRHAQYLYCYDVKGE